MVKSKFVFHFGDGSKMSDRNGYNTLNQAKSWSKSHNKYTQRKKDKIVKVTTIKKKKGGKK